MDNIVQCANRNIQLVIDKFSDPLDGSKKYRLVKLVDRVDIEAFIGTLYLRAAFSLNILDREVIWNYESAHDIINATISLNRFKFNCCLINFDDKDWKICLYERTISEHKWKECNYEASFSLDCYWLDLVSILGTYWIQSTQSKQTS